MWCSCHHQGLFLSLCLNYCLKGRILIFTYYLLLLILIFILLVLRLFYNYFTIFNIFQVFLIFLTVKRF